MASLDTFDATQPIHLLLQHLRQGDRQKAMEQLVVLGLELGMASEPLRAPGLQTVFLETARAVVQELGGLIGQRRDIAARLAAEGSHSAASVIGHNTAQLEAVADALAALCEHRGFLVVQD